MNKNKIAEIYKKDTHERFLVWRRLQMNFKITLNDDHLDVIDEIYFDHQKEAIKTIGIYRLINVVFGLIALGVWFGVRETEFEKWFFGCSTLLFLIVNVINGIQVKMKHRRLVQRIEAIANGE